MKKFEWTPSATGFAFLALSIPSFAADWIGRWVDRAGTRIPGSTAFSLSAVAITLLRFVQINTIATHVLLIGLLFVVGVTIVLAQVSSMMQASQVVIAAESRRPGIFGDRTPTAQAYALFNMACAVGQMCGPLLGGSVKAHAGWNAMTLVLGLFCGVVACVVGFCSESPMVVEQVGHSEAGPGSGSEEV
jgi:MFS family permease